MYPPTVPDFTLDQIKEAFREVVREELAALKATASDVPPDERFLTIEETCNRLKVGRTTLWGLRRQARLQARQVGRRVLFRESDVLALAEGTSP